MTHQELQKIANDCFEEGKVRAARGDLLSARAHFDLADAFYRDASLARIKSGLGI